MSSGYHHHAPAPYVILPQMKSPPISGLALMPGGGKRIITLNDDVFVGKWVVLAFYAADWTRICASELADFSSRKLDFDEAGCEVVFCSTDSFNSHAAWTSTPPNEGGVGRIGYPLIADRNHTVAKSFGVIKKVNATSKVNLNFWGQ